ncbi:MAG: hypothetical protein E6Q97_22550 [Desulfurellales bacterium]|nr:MAG: hypothetical protein E6Q97_22550 [Desulfurellales bacterium]
MSYNHLLNSHFSGKPVIAQINDTGRNRLIKVFYIDSPTEVGMFDGVDAWVATAATAVRHPDLTKAIQDHLAGVPASFPATSRRVLVDESKPTRRALLNQPTERRRVYVE